MNREEYMKQQKIAKLFNELQPVFEEIFQEIENCVARIAAHVLKKYFSEFKDEKWSHGQVAVTVRAAIDMVSNELQSDRSFSEIIDKVYVLEDVWK